MLLRWFTLAVLCALVRSFPQGGPAESCDSMLPRHIYTHPKPAAESPYAFVASSSHYSAQNVQGIQVGISGEIFKGFFVVAVDPGTHKRIGAFAPVKGTHTIPCAAATHADAKPKNRVTLLWLPPKDHEGSVVFMATIVKSFGQYWTGVVAQVPAAAGYAAAGAKASSAK